MRFYWRLSLLMLILGVLPLSAYAQDPAPSPTSIPILIITTEESAAPSLGGGALAPVGSTPATLTTPLPEATSEVDIFSQANTASVCPFGISDSFRTTEFVCETVAAGEACLGFGTVNTTFTASATGTTFARSGDKARIKDLSELRLISTGTENNFWTTVSSRFEFNSTDGGLPTATQMLLFGDVTVVDRGTVASGGAFSGRVLAQRGLVVRRTPENQGVVVWQLNAGEVVQVTGRTPDREWLRMEIPSLYGGVGWVYAPYMEVEGGVDNLPFVTTASPRPELAAPDFGPMQAFLMLTTNTALECDAAIPDSGILVQSPSGLPDAVAFEMNDVEIRLNGTVFITAQANTSLRITILEGEAKAIVNGTETAGQTGLILNIPMNGNLEPSGGVQLEEALLSALSSLPLNLLDRPFELAGVSAPPVENPVSAFGTPAAPVDNSAITFGTPAAPLEATTTACTLTTPNEIRNLRSGPGLAYPVINVLQPNSTTTATGVASDEFNVFWYEVAVGGFMRLDTVTSTGNCSSLPLVTAPLPPPAVTGTVDFAAQTPVATASLAPANQSLSSSALGAVTCPDGETTGSTTSDGTNTFVSIGGTWSAGAGTSVTFNTLGGQLRPEIGNYIQIVGLDGTVLAQSGEARSLNFTFSQATSFSTRFSAGNGDLVLMSVRCGR